MFTDQIKFIYVTDIGNLDVQLIGKPGYGCYR